MRVRGAGDRAVLLEVAGTDEVAALRAEVAALVEDGRLAAPVDVVPGARTLLLDGVDVPTAGRLLAGWTPARPGPRPPPARSVEVPVVYDGTDLAEVARLWGVSERDVVARHTSTRFRVAFCGFAPGFPYLVGLDADVPRRASPRPRVPAGAVGLAGRYCGIYPTASPGGWQLLGTTTAALFDVARDPPALLPPGTSVRFREVAAPDAPDALSAPAVAAPRAGDRRVLRVVRAGALTTVQDAGRAGLAHLGVPRAGPLDRPAARLANRLVGNREDAGLLETTLDGCTLVAGAPLTVAVTGAMAAVTAGGRAVAWGVAVGVAAGDVLDLGPATQGLRCYLAVAGGIAVPEVLGSRSTDTLSWLGPGRVTAADVLPVGRPEKPPPPVEFTVHSVPAGPLVLRLRLGPRDDWFGADGLEVLRRGPWTLSPTGNRIGARLSGPTVPRRRSGELESEGMVLGAVQVPPDGQPVVLLADHPTTGGYPVVGVVDPRDLAPLAQRRPGTAVRFTFDPPSGAVPGGTVAAVIDLNSDLGEGFGVWRLGDDDALLRIVSSANVACGFHAGDPPTLRKVTAQAASLGVAVGAQVSYRDLAGFGRRRMDIAPAELTDDVLYQLGALDGFCRVAGDRVRYVKPHGALYNTVVDDDEQAAAVVRAVLEYDRSLPVLCLPGSALLRRAEAAGLPAVAEGFVDRGYTPAGRLVPRRLPGALVTDADAVVERAVRMARAGEVVAVDGTVLRLPVRSLCVHGDTPGAVPLARRVRAALEAAGLPPTPFAG